jgi:hypothetical protein
MIYVKEGVVFKRLLPAIYNLFPVIDAVWKEHAGISATITSANDGKHMVGSKHGTDAAIDLRTFNLSVEQREKIFEALKAQLQPMGYDVLWENRFQHNDHFHIEWDPK